MAILSPFHRWLRWSGWSAGISAGILVVLLLVLVLVLPSAHVHADTIYLPLVQKSPEPRPQVPFGVETSPGRITSDAMQQRASELGAGWIRLRSLNWRDIQPEEGLPQSEWNWDALERLEGDLLAAAEPGLTPIVVVFKNPDWAMKLNEGQTEYAPCGAIHEDHFGDFATFMQEVVRRYSRPPYNVHHWEFGNEPDVDPRILGNFPEMQEFFGCWGDWDDPTYGGRHYGEMLKVVTPAIKHIDPTAKIVNGGVLLNSPDTQDEHPSQPEDFLGGVLDVEAETSEDILDIVAFHAYPWYSWEKGRQVDADIAENTWTSWGGVTLGKIAYITQLMSERNIEPAKPLFLNEAAMIASFDPEQPPDDELHPDFLQAQADHVVRQLTRSLSKGVPMYCWYTLHRSGWNASGLLNGDNSPRPVFLAYSQFISQTQFKEGDPLPIRIDAVYESYVDEVQAYRFNRGTHYLDVLWSLDGYNDWAAGDVKEFYVDVPEDAFVAAYRRDGEAAETFVLSDMVKVEVVGVEPTYILRTP
jgi:hypothetical protein